MGDKRREEIVLQIATGQLFKGATWRENELRGMLYTNALIGPEESITTAIGRLLPSSSTSLQPQVVVYEFVERIEVAAQGPNVLVSSGVEPYLQDFAVVVAFALNCVCTPDVDLCRRLTNGQRGLSTRVSPRTLVKRFFDGEIWCQQEDRDFLVEFTAKLIRLPRQTFLGVMRSLRTYISGMYRIADDLELAYTLLVASVESLAQDFDGHQSDWESLDGRKRKAIDGALVGVEPIVAQRVRDALLAVEHTALARRFREFATDHIKPEYFRPPACPEGQGLGRSDLKEALGLAYQSRSKYVHQLKRLPQMIALSHQFGETAIEDRATHLTLQGLARLMRSVIIEFVARQPVVDHEPYDYTLELSGVVQVRMAAQYWVGRTEGDISLLGRNKLEGFLEQLASCLLKEPGATVTDLRPVLALAIDFVPRLERRYRLPYLALLAAFNGYVPESERASVPEDIEALIDKDLTEASLEALLVHTLFDHPSPWSVEEHKELVESYLRQRGAKSGLRFPIVFEAAAILNLAEQYRASGSMERCRQVIALAVENHPGHARLLDFEKGFEMDAPIRWHGILLPHLEQTVSKAV